MKRMLSISALIVLGLSACAPAPLQAQNEAFIPRRCLNLGNALNAPNEGEWGYVIRQEDLQRIASAGFDSVRIPINWHDHAMAGPPYTIDPAYFTRIDAVITQALAYDLRVIIDMHDYEALYKDPARHTPRAIALWQQIARHYAAAPTSLIFEPLNEPQEKLQGAQWQTLSAQLLNAVRRSNASRWVILGGDNWNSIDGLRRFSPPADDHLVLTFHYYDPYNFTHQGATWFDGAPPVGQEWGSVKERKHLQTEMSRAARIARQKGYPLWLGEFGALETAPTQSRIQWVKAVRQASENAGIGWCAYDYATEFGAYDQIKKRWIEPMRDALLGSKHLALRRNAD